MIIRTTNREQWLAERQKGIGSSEVGVLMGVSQYETPYDLWRRRKGLVSPKEETFAMRAGHILEPAVAQFWQEATGKQIIKRSAGDWLIADDERPYLRVSPDRTYWLSDSRQWHHKGILECKTTQRDIDPAELPLTWYCQVQYQLGVARLERGSLAWLTAGRSFGYADIEFDPAFYAQIVEAVEEFWTRYIVGNEVPEPLNAADMAALHPTHTEGKVAEATPDMAATVGELRETRAQIAMLKQREEQLADEVKMAIGDAEALSLGGITLATWKAAKPASRFDVKRFTADHPDMAAQYTHPAAPMRQLKIK